MATATVPVFKCPMCNTCLPGACSYISHFRLVHATDANFDVTCQFGRCQRRFLRFAAFNSHVYRDHREEVVERRASSSPMTSLNLAALQQENASISAFEFEMGPTGSPTSSEMDTVPEAILHQILHTDLLEQQKFSAEFLLKLKEQDRLSQKTIDDVMKGLTNIVEHTMSRMRAGVQERLAVAGINYSDVPDLDDFLKSVDSPFEGVHTTYLQEKFFFEHFGYLEAKEVVLGESNFEPRFSGAQRELHEKQDKFYYVPLLPMLKKVLGHAQVRYEIDHPHQLGGDKLEDFCDGEVYKSHPMFSTNPQALQIIAYFDELEVCNPIGTFVRKNKLGCLFFTLGNIRPQFRSTLKAIFLLAVGRSVDIDRYGIDSFLTPFVEDLKTLYLDGFTIEVEQVTRTYHGALLAMLADNLAAHSLAGFKANFSFALRLCRSCMATTRQIQTMFIECDFELRTPESHWEQCELLQGPLCSHFSTTFGVNRRSKLEEIPGFSVINGIPHDILHDLLEGVALYELKLLFQHCTSHNYFGMDELNRRIARFDFGSHTRPAYIEPTVAQDTQKKVHQTAEQMLVLIQFLPLIIGDKIPEDDQAWRSFLLLCKICEIALSPICTAGLISYLQVLVEEKLSLFTAIYPHQKIVPKMHYLVHYPAQIKRFGPLIHSWTMRYEGKLSFIKRASCGGNFKNVCLSAAKHHQLWICYQLLQGDFLYPRLEYGPSSISMQYSEEPSALQSRILQLYPSVSAETVLYHPKWAQLCSRCYQKDSSYILVTPDPMYPVFGKVIEIIVFGSNCVLIVQLYKTEYFDNHYNSYVVRSTPANTQLRLDQILYHHILRAHTNYVPSERTLYISLPFAV